ncbi:uncharacterized membrane protein, required for N-linked glycosylation [Bellilinea caldifistulae]|uniref:Glycosyltransferase RgtA/B/C/D-like domain-containing protein n=1 Tax=Bellilinea caldifistulae TaxID=360411 RepID=A0A0P6X4R2_9CHLR|nr:glycosyltransferase family 39 protein [Bellilinea caldifistulae]KPL74893.1 hypothetical protein AC812_10215 [Bellilinea caldifistulae]GAP10515.1 uncharacterized membrane protein, required for N-linked glycosylation [Bellilinea caldifistulae]
MDESKEPTVLDYVKALLMPWKGKPPALSAKQPTADQSLVEPKEDLSTSPDITTLEMKVEEKGEPVVFPSSAEERLKLPIGWRTLLAFVLAVIGQSFLEPPRQQVSVALIFYGLAVVALIFAVISKEWLLAEYADHTATPMAVTVNRNPILLSLPLLLLAFIFFSGNRFTTLNLTLWLAGTISLVAGFYLPSRTRLSLKSKIRSFFLAPQVIIRITPWSILVLLAIGLVVFFRFYRLSEVPGEMFSDHAEKLMDVADVLQGQTSIFFPRNTGREAIQMYLTALIAIVAGTKLSFMSLKIGTALAGVLTLPFIYFSGREIGGNRVGLLAFVLAGVAYWANVIARIGLRFPLYPLFAAPTLYFLVKGLKYRSRNDFIWAGIFLGLGLHGYSPARLVPMVVVAAVIIYLIHRQSEGNRREAVIALILLAITSLAVFLPLLRYALSDPEMFAYRALTRLGETETVYPAPVGIVFLNNLWKSMIMFFYKNGNIWVHSIPNRPALDVISAALFFLGSTLVVIRYIRQRHWLDLFLLVSIPLLMMPSILSLAFPEENPSLNRSGGAIIPVFILAAVGLDAVIRSIERRYSNGYQRIIPLGVTALLIFFISSANYDLVFRQFDRQFMAGAWNTSQIGAVIRGFSEAQGNPDTAYVVPYPHWVDTRLVGINAGFPLKDYALWPDQFETTLSETRAKLFVINPRDEDAVHKLQELYPTGWLYFYDVELEGKDFLLYFVPPAGTEDGTVQP